MALTVTHPFVSTLPPGTNDGVPGGKVGPNEWNADHVISGQGWLHQTTTYAASALDQVIGDTSSSGWTMTLPGNPSVGNSVSLIDPFNSWGLNNLTVAGNSANIVGSASNFTCDVGNQKLLFIYVGSTIGWKVIAQ